MPSNLWDVLAQAEPQQLTLVPPGAWEVDPDRSSVGFEVRHLKLARVRGRFHAPAGVVRCDSDGSASIAGSISVASIDTGDPRRDARLCAQEFFDAERYPMICFDGFSPPVAAGQALTVRGTMTIRGISRPLEIRAERSWPDDDNSSRDTRVRAGGVVSRSEFGLDWDSAFAAGGLVIDDRVALRLDVVLVRRTRSS